MTNSSALPLFTDCKHFTLTSLETVCVDEVRLHVAATPITHCAFDPEPTWTTLHPRGRQLLSSHSLTSQAWTGPKFIGKFPVSFELAVPVLERVVLKQVTSYLYEANLFLLY